MARNPKPSGIVKNSEKDEIDFQRTIENKTIVQDIIIACEDKVSAPTYFKMIIKNLIDKKIITQDSLVIAKPTNTHPTGVLEDLKNHITDEGKTYNEFDHKWIVIDRDVERVNGGGHTKENFNEALTSAKTLNVEVAYANDSFELWYFLHFHYTDSAISRDDVLKKVINSLKDKNSTTFAELDKDSIKTKEYTKLIFGELLQNQSIAIRNAEKLLLSHGASHNPESDASTTIHELIKVLNSLNKNILTYETEFCRVEYSEKYNTVLCTWKKFCQGDNYRDPLEHGLSILKESGCKTWITDTRNGFKNQEEDTKWLIHNFTPQVSATSCENLYFIMEDDSKLEEEIIMQSEALSTYFNVEIYKTLEEVK